VRTYVESVAKTCPAKNMVLCKRDFSPEQPAAGYQGVTHTYIKKFHNHGRTISPDNADQCAWQFGKTTIWDLRLKPYGQNPWEIAINDTGRTRAALTDIPDGPCDALCGSCKYALPTSVLQRWTYSFSVTTSFYDATHASFSAYTILPGDAGYGAGANVGGGHNSNNDAQAERVMYDWILASRGYDNWRDWSADQTVQFCQSYCNNAAPGALGQQTPANIAACHGYPGSSLADAADNAPLAVCRIGFPVGIDTTGPSDGEADTLYADYSRQPQAFMGNPTIIHPTNFKIVTRGNGACIDAWGAKHPEVVAPKRGNPSCGIDYGPQTSPICGPKSGKQPACVKPAYTQVYAFVCGLG
jgi:hypothetical protein